MRPPLRFVTYLAPGLPLPLFERIAAAIGRAVGQDVTLRVDETRSGPVPGDDPFTSGEADVGFVCAPAYLWLADEVPPSVLLVNAAPVFCDPRTNGEPLYLSDVIVPADHPATTLADLRGAVWAYNDSSSLSGYFAVLDLHARNQWPQPILVPVGSHASAAAAVRAGFADAAALDANVLAAGRQRDPSFMAGLRIVGSLGPFAVQPVVLRTGLEPLAGAIGQAMLDMNLDAGDRRALAAAGVIGFAPVSEANYAYERELLRRCARFTAGRSAT